MGVFDELTCKYPLPIKGANEIKFQTKDTPSQYLDNYEIREDGSLWHEIYDTEDKSDPNAEGLLRICGMLSRVNKRWEAELITGEIVFYGSLPDETWVEFSAYFVDGTIKYLHVLEPVPCEEPKQP